MSEERDDILQAVYDVIQRRKGTSPESSYTAALFARGTDTILKKLGEEATEVVIAGKADDRLQIVHEVADLFFHTLVLLGHRDIPLQEVYGELRRRFGTSGIEEKRTRGN
jgi:phosphoribosyl-ATP pyrophosphohydrolase